MEQLSARHQKEIRDLQSRITQKKKSATKKNRKGVNYECDTLERELKERHAREVAELNGEVPDSSGGPSILDLSDHSDPEEQDLPVSNLQPRQIEQSSADQTPTSEECRQPKKNRQKERMARRAAQMERMVAQAEEEASSQPNLRDQEREEMARVFIDQGLREVQIRPDGHCLYSAFADQLQSLGIDVGSTGEEAGYKAVRRRAADFIARHPDDFVPFLEEPMDDYLVKVRDTAEWGGQLELMALSRSFGVVINVVQGGGRVERICPDSGGADDGVAVQVWLAYSRHSFGLGEHYNSLRKI